MKHRITLFVDVRERMDEYAQALGVTPEQANEAFEWMLANDVAFQEGETQYAISSLDIEHAIEPELPRRFYGVLKRELGIKLLPLYGYNWATFFDRVRRCWEQVYNMLINKIPFHCVRLAWLRLGGAKIGKGSTIWRNTEVIGMENLVIGEDSVVAWHCQIDARAGVRIGDHVTIASYVQIIPGGHDAMSPEFWGVCKPIVIEDYAWITTRAMILQGGYIGRGAVVTANTVITKEIAPYKIVGGIGAKVMGERPHNLNYKVGGKSLFTFLH